MKKQVRGCSAAVGVGSHGMLNIADLQRFEGGIAGASHSLATEESYREDAQLMASSQLD